VLFLRIPTHALQYDCVDPTGIQSPKDGIECSKRRNSCPTARKSADGGRIQRSDRFVFRATWFVPPWVCIYDVEFVSGWPMPARARLASKTPGLMTPSTVPMRLQRERTPKVRPLEIGLGGVLAPGSESSRRRAVSARVHNIIRCCTKLRA